MSQSLKSSENGEKPFAIEKIVPAALPQPQEVPPPQIQIDDSKVVSTYSNFCRLSGTPEELIFDFGLNFPPSGVSIRPIAVTQRIIMDYFTAKRTLHALQLTIERHENVFGVLETDVQRRVQRPAQG
jgi:hypothetical protein